jgi:hypothetical protein
MENKTICGADCSKCTMKADCNGCNETKGCPFGEKCFIAEYIKLGGMDSYNDFKRILTAEVNAILEDLGIPNTDALYELPGVYVNLEYPLPSGNTVKLLNDKRIYLGCQLEFADMGICYGVVADTTFIMVCSYIVNGSEPELLLYKKR